MEKSKENEKVLLGQRIRSLRNTKGWTQQELGELSDVNYKFLGEIERGQQNPSFAVLVRIADALGVDLPELFRFEQMAMDRKDVVDQINAILKSLPDGDLNRMLSVLRVLYPVAW